MKLFLRADFGLAVTLIAALAVAPCELLAQPLSPATVWPAKPIRLIVPFAAGGSTDVVARSLAAGLQEAWAQPVVLDLRPGAGGTIGSELAARAAADGYTLLIGSVSTHAIAPHVYTKLPYDPVRDFTPVSEIVQFPTLLVANPALPVRNLRELVSLARKRPGELTYASNGIGTNSHVAGELLKHTAGIDLVHVPYKGGAPAVADVVGGHVAIAFSGASNVLPYLNAGRLRVLGVASRVRSPVVPEVPTIIESGLADFEVTIWLGLWAPPGLPVDLVNRVHTAAIAVLRSPRLRDLAVAQGAEIVGSTPAAFAQRVREELARWKRLIALAGVKPE